MIQTNRKGINYAENLLDSYLTFETTQTWTVSSGTGTGANSNDVSFYGTKSLKIQNTAPTTDITITNSTQNTVIANKTAEAQLSFYLYKSSASDEFTGNVKIFKNAVLLDTQTWTLEASQDAQWYRFVSDQKYSLVTTDVITFTFTFDGDAGFVGTKTVYIDGLMLNPTKRGDFWPPIYQVPTSNITTQIFGVYDYNDDTTSTTPISLSSNTWTLVTNDEAGANTNLSYGLPDVATIYDGASSLFDFSDLELGDTVSIRFDAEITTSGANQTCDVDLVLAYGTGSEYRIPFYRNEFKTADAHRVTVFNDIYMGNTATLNNNARFEIRSDSSADVEVFGWYCKVNKRLV